MEFHMNHMHPCIKLYKIHAYPSKFQQFFQPHLSGHTQQNAWHMVLNPHKRLLFFCDVSVLGSSETNWHHSKMYTWYTFV